MDTLPKNSAADDINALERYLKATVRATPRFSVTADDVVRKSMHEGVRRPSDNRVTFLTMSFVRPLFAGTLCAVLAVGGYFLFRNPTISNDIAEEEARFSQNESTAIALKATPDSSSSALLVDETLPVSVDAIADELVSDSRQESDDAASVIETYTDGTDPSNLDALTSLTM